MSSSGNRLDGAARGAQSIREVAGAFERAGFRGQFASGEHGTVECFTCRQISDADAMPVEHLRRLEGASDPADMLAVVALTCPRCGTEGILILGYGPAAAAQDSEILERLELPPAKDRGDS